MGDRNPFDLSSAIELLRSIPSYPAAPISSEVKSQIGSLQDPIKIQCFFSERGLCEEHLNTKIQRDLSPTHEGRPLKSSTSSGHLDHLPLPSTGSMHDCTSKETLTDKITQRTTTNSRHISNPPSSSQWPALRRLQLIEKLTDDFKDFGPIITSPNSLANRSPTKIHVFVDYSNISIAFYESLKKTQSLKKATKSPLLNLSFQNLALILERGRKAEKKILVGSTKSSILVEEARDIGYEVNILRRVPKDENLNSLIPHQVSQGQPPSDPSRKNKEQCVDEIIIMKMLESLVDYKPSTIVLATGDGNITDFSEGFFRAVERFLAYGWLVELVSFQRSLSKSWKTINSSRFRVIVLDGYLDNLCN